jgi:gluconokinase
VILTVDVGSSSARAALHDESGRGLDGAFHQVAYRADTTPDGGMAHDARRLLEAVTACIDAVLARPRMPDVAAVAITTFWHGLLGFDAAGHAVTPIYMWGDTRSAREAALLRGALDEAAVHARTGCPLHSSYWPAKLRWLARENPAAARSVARWGSFGEHLELTFFGEAATTISMASATGLFDQEALRWDAEAVVAAELETGRLFPLCDRHQPRRDLRAPWARRWPALRGVPFFPAIGDGAAGNVGSGCIDPTRVALNVGTSAALRVATTTPGAPPRGLWRYRLDRRVSLIGGVSRHAAIAAAC